MTVLLTLSDQDIQLEFDGEKVGFLRGEEQVSVFDPALLDILAPGAAIAIALGRLSFLFNYADRGKVFIENEANRRLPIGSAIINVSSGATEWRFATFFMQAIVAAVMVYAVLVIALRILRAEDVKSLPKGAKIAKLLHL